MQSGKMDTMVPVTMKGQMEEEEPLKGLTCSQGRGTLTVKEWVTDTRRKVVQKTASGQRRGQIR